jgi:hypothetical protein
MLQIIKQKNRKSIMKLLCSESFFNGPSIGSNSLVKSVFLKANLSRPFANTVGFSIESYKNGSSPVLSLLSNCSPSAVFFTVMTIVINSVNRCITFAKFLYMRLVRFEHIISEFFKGLPKAFDTSPSIIFVSPSHNFIATTVDSYIRSVKLLIFTLRKTMLSSQFFSKATARFGSPFQVSSLDFNFFSTITYAKPNSTTIRASLGQERNNKQSAESFISQIFTTHNTIIT